MKPCTMIGAAAGAICCWCCCWNATNAAMATLALPQRSSLCCLNRAWSAMMLFNLFLDKIKNFLPVSVLSFSLRLKTVTPSAELTQAMLPAALQLLAAWLSQS
jgi:hypothetical protein